MAISFHGFVGQKHTVSHLKTQLHGAQALNQPCPHMLLIGPSGMGKTKLAKALATEAGTDCRVIHGKASLGDLCEQLVPMIKGDFLLLDEAHTLPKEVQEALYEVIDTGVMSDRLSAARASKLTVTPVKDKKGKIVIAPITFVLATNQPSGLLEALHRRMELTVYINDYERNELVDIARSVASEHKLLFSKSALKWLAVSSQGQPSRVVNSIKGIRRVFYGQIHRELTHHDVFAYLKTTGRNPRGLDKEQQMYMKLLYKKRMGVATLSSLLGLELEYVITKIEPGLIRLGFLYKGGGGRRLTEKGEAWLRDKKAMSRANKEKRLKDEQKEKESPTDRSQEYQGPEQTSGPDGGSSPSPNHPFGTP